MKYSIADLLGLYSECRADMEIALSNRAQQMAGKPHFGINVNADPLARLYQRRRRFAKKLGDMIRSRAAALETNEAFYRRQCLMMGAQLAAQVMGDEDDD